MTEQIPHCGIQHTAPEKKKKKKKKKKGQDSNRHKVRHKERKGGKRNCR